MTRLHKTLLALMVSAPLALAGCIETPTLQEACADRGGVASFPKPTEDEGYCKDGTEMEDSGSGFAVDR